MANSNRAALTRSVAWAFGTTRQAIILRTAGRAITLKLQIWSDRSIFVEVPDDISGIPDGAAELVIGVGGKAPMKTTRFPFYAAREDVVVPIPTSAFTRVNGGETQLDGTRVAQGSNVAKTTFDGNAFAVNREIEDTDSAKRCVQPGRDHIAYPRLAPGFERTAWYFERNWFGNSKNDIYTTTPRGSWNFRDDGDGISIDYGVIRRYFAPAMAIGAHGFGDCYAKYTIRMIATGPRGMPVLP